MMKKRTIYCQPVTEKLRLSVESVLNPSTWNPDSGHAEDMGVIEGDPLDENGELYDGHGAKAYNPYAFFDIDWDDNDYSLWD